MKLFFVLMITLFLITGCSGITSNTVIEQDFSAKTYNVMYKLSLDDGEILEKTTEPFTFTIGERKVLPAFEKEIGTMDVGDEKSFIIDAKNGYGLHRPDLVVEVPKNSLPVENSPEVGMLLTLSNPDGEVYQGKIVQILDDSIAVDLNHPLAGENLHFDVEVVGID
jgi:FKBP-type peptidyl-prolyl cis-trans isomerase 2